MWKKSRNEKDTAIKHFYQDNADTAYGKRLIWRQISFYSIIYYNPV